MNELDHLIDEATRQMAQHEPEDALSGAVMERVAAGGPRVPPRWLEGGRVAEACGVASAVESSALGDDPLAALASGEDHSLLAAFAPGTELPGGFRRVGVVVAGDGVLVDGRPYEELGGWDPYLGWDGRSG